MLVEILILLTSIPTGMLLAWLCDDELKAGKKWFLTLASLSFAVFLACYIFYYNTAIMFSLLYIIGVCAISGLRS